MSPWLELRTAEARAVELALKEHFPDHPRAYPPSAYRYNPASICVRVVSKRFKGKDFFQRLDMVRPAVDTLPEETQQHIFMLFLFSPEEVKKSSRNWAFENPEWPEVEDRQPA